MKSHRLISPPIRRRSSSAAGFTFVELMIVVTIIGVLSALAVATFNRVRSHSKNVVFQNELRVASHAMETYATEKGDWPADGNGGWPEGVADYLPPPKRWNLPTPVGGTWAWVRDGDGVKAALKISGYQGGTERGLELDRLIDDGDLAAGNFRVTPDHLLYVLQE